MDLHGVRVFLIVRFQYKADIHQLKKDRIKSVKMGQNYFNQ